MTDDGTSNSVAGRIIDEDADPKRSIPRYYIKVEDISKSEVKHKIAIDHPPTEEEIESEYKREKD